MIYDTVVGAMSLLCVNAPEARLMLSRVDVVTDDLISSDSDLLETMLLGTDASDHQRTQERN